MSQYAATLTRRLPRGWAHLGLQFAFWIGFYFAYQAARGLADHGGVATAFANGEWIIEFQRNLSAMLELTLQRAVERSTFLIQATSLTYWLSQFAVVGIALLWVYFKAHDRFYGFRNTLIVGNLIGLVGYVLVPTAPPRMFPEAGFTDKLAAHSTVNHSSKLLWLGWAPWVWFSVMATGNHFWLDIAAGIAVAALAGAIVYRPWRRLRPRAA